MKAQSEGQVQQDQMECDWVADSEGDSGEKECGDGAGGKKSVEDDGQDGAENRPGKNKKKKKTKTFFDLCHAEEFLSG